MEQLNQSNLLEQVAITIKNKRAKYNPGDNIIIDFNLDKVNDVSSTLHISSIDQRVRYFGNENDVHSDRFHNAVRSFYRSKENATEKVVKDFEDARYDDVIDFNAFFISNAFRTESEITCGIADTRTSAKYAQPGSDLDSTEASVNTDGQPDYVRENFLETYLFEDITSEISRNSYQHQGPVPDSITTFLVNAFVFHPIHGVGFADEQNFLVSQNFFVKTFLPYSIHVGEVLKVRVGVYNYVPGSKALRNVMVKFAILDDGDCEIVTLTPVNGICKSQKIDGMDQTKKIAEIAENEAGEVTFFVKALQQEKLRFMISAKDSKGNRDSVIKELLVEHAGIRGFKNEAKFINLESSSHDSFNFQIKVPSDVIRNSVEVKSTVYGNLLGQVFDNAENLIQAPYGEQINKIA